MKRGQNIFYLVGILFVVIMAYFLVKFLMRPFVIKQEALDFLNVFVYSFPNFCEAVTGSIFITLLLIVGNGLLTNINAGYRINEKLLYFAAVIIAGAYVLLQEYNVHSLGGINVFDPNDALFSIIGLATAYSIINVVNPRLESDS